jgi:hypothetical protein
MLSKSGMIEISTIKLAKNDTALKYFYTQVNLTDAILNGTLQSWYMPTTYINGIY